MRILQTGEEHLLQTKTFTDETFSITQHYAALLVATGIYFSNSPFVFSQDLNWIKQISGTNAEFIRSMATDASGNLYVVGAFNGTIDFDNNGTVDATATGTDVWFGKYNSSGGFLWAKVLTGGGDDVGRDIVLDNSGNIYITGTFETVAPTFDFDPGPGSFTSAYPGAFFAKYNSSGNFVWAKAIGGSGTPIADAIALDASNNVYISGDFSGTIDFDPNAGVQNRSGTSGRAFLAKYNSSGAYQWVRQIGDGNNGAEAKDIQITGSNAYVVGKFNGTNLKFNGTSTNLNSNTGSAYLIKANTSGTYGWAKQMTPGNAGDESVQCALDGSGNIYVTGLQQGNGQDIFLARYTPTGVQSWIAKIGGQFQDHGQSIVVDGSHIYMAGFFTGIGSPINFNPLGSPPINLNIPQFKADFFLAKYNTSTGHATWARNLDMTLNAPDYFVNAIRISNGKPVLAGNFNGYGDFNACASSTVFSSTTVDGFLAGFDPTTLPLEIAGPGVLCATGTFNYTVTNPPQGATINWAITPSANFNPSSGTGTSFSTNSVGSFSGSATVTASVAGACPNSGQLSVWAGTRAPTGFISVVVDPWMRRILAFVQQVPGATGYEWYLDGVKYTGPGMNNDYVAMPISNSCSIPGYTVGVKAINACGTSTMYSEFHVNPCYGGGFLFSAYPNPASEKLVLESNSPYQSQSVEVALGAETEREPSYFYKLHDFNTNQLVLQGSIARKAEIELSTLLPGRYILKIQTDQTQEEVHHILIVSQTQSK